MNNLEIKNIGFIGLGVMGSSMCKNLLKNKKWKILVKDLDQKKEKKLKNLGAKIAEDVKEVFKLSDLVITCLPGGGFVEDLYLGKNKNISYVKTNRFIIDMSTSQPDLMIRLEEKIKIL